MQEQHHAAWGLMNRNTQRPINSVNDVCMAVVVTVRIRQVGRFLPNHSPLDFLQGHLAQRRCLRLAV